MNLTRLNRHHNSINVERAQWVNGGNYNPDSTTDSFRAQSGSRGARWATVAVRPIAAGHSRGLGSYEGQAIPERVLYGHFFRTPRRVVDLGLRETVVFLAQLLVELCQVVCLYP